MTKRILPGVLVFCLFILSVPARTGIRAGAQVTERLPYPLRFTARIVLAEQDVRVSVVDLLAGFAVLRGGNLELPAGSAAPGEHVTVLHRGLTIGQGWAGEDGSVAVPVGSINAGRLVILRSAAPLALKGLENLGPGNLHDVAGFDPVHRIFAMFLQGSGYAYWALAKLSTQGKWEYLPVPPSLDGFGALAGDGTGGLFAGGRDYNGNYRYWRRPPGQEAWLGPYYSPGGPFQEILRGGDGHVYAVCGDTAWFAGGIYRWAEPGWQYVAPRVSKRMIGRGRLGVDSSGRLYGCENNGSVPYRWTGSAWQALPGYPLSGSIVSLGFDRGRLWVVAGGQPAAWDGTGWVVAGRPQGMNVLKALRADGAVWVLAVDGTGQKWLAVLDGDSWQVVLPVPPVVAGFAGVDGDGSVYLYGGGVYRLPCAAW